MPQTLLNLRKSQKNKSSLKIKDITSKQQNSWTDKNIIAHDVSDNNYLNEENFVWTLALKMGDLVPRFRFWELWVQKPLGLKTCLNQPQVDHQQISVLFLGTLQNIRLVISFVQVRLRQKYYIPQV